MVLEETAKKDSRQREYKKKDRSLTAWSTSTLSQEKNEKMEENGKETLIILI